MKLIKATKEIFDDLEAQWQGQLAKYDEKLEDYVTAFREHCRSVIKGNHKNYFVYVLESGGAYEGFLHINRDRIKRLPGHTLRALEVCLAPIYDYEDVPAQKMGRLCAGIYAGLLDMATSKDLASKTVKLHMGPLDKEFLMAYAIVLSSKHRLDSMVQGAWLITKRES